MSDTITHDGYVATVSLDFDNEILHGSVINTRDVLTFEAADLAGLQEAFRATIDDYKAWCAEEGVAPERPYSGNVSLRLPVEIHRLAAVQASTQGVSLNAWFVSTIECALNRRPLTMTQAELDIQVAAMRDDVLTIVGKTVVSNYGYNDDLVWQNLPDQTRRISVQ